VIAVSNCVEGPVGLVAEPDATGLEAPIPVEVSECGDVGSWFLDPTLRSMTG